MAIPSQTRRGLAWLDGESLVLAMASEASSVQLWRLSYPDGRLSRLTNDINQYDGLSLTADRRSPVTERTETRVGVWIGDGSARQGMEAVPASPFEGQTAGATVAWAADRLLYTTRTGGHWSIVRLGPGRERPEPVVSNAVAPASTSDGRTIVYVSSEEGGRVGLWRVDSEGRHAVQLTARSGSTTVMAPDDRSVFFIGGLTGLQPPWSVSLDGGQPSQVVNMYAGFGSVDVSPDGKRLVFRWRDEQNRPSLIVCAIPGCTDRGTVTSQSDTGRVRWTPDGQGIAYPDPGTVTNIWVQPLDGRPAYQLTHFDDCTITDFAWSRDGKRLAIARASVTNDIVLFKGLKK